MVKRHIKPQERVLDFGCGPGFLLEKIANALAVKLYVVDTSSENVTLAKQRLSSRKNFGFVELLSENFFKKNQSTFDVVFLIECLEHIPSQETQNILCKISSLLTQGGRIIITVPNKEDFVRSQCVCPNCGAVFHKYQHLTRWNPKKIIEFTSAANLECLLCKETAFTGFHFLNFLYAIAHKFYYGYKPNLVYIGRKI